MKIEWSEGEDGLSGTKKTTMHKCTKKDLDKFYTPNRAAAKNFERMKNDLMCVDHENDDGSEINHKIFGQ
jgi:hypothetical protein